MTDKRLGVLSAPSMYPNPSLAALKLQYVGQRIEDVQPPAAILDAAVVRRNCALMLEAAQELGVGFRAHVKTHKTTEITNLQVGEQSNSVKLICSTVSEIENLVPWLLEQKSKGKAISVLYGLPLSLSQIPRLAAINRLLGPRSIGLFTDHPGHIEALGRIDEVVWPDRIPVWVNIDVGDHREGVGPESSQLTDIAYAIKKSRRVRLAGLYAHMGSSYSSNNPEEALQFMAAELTGLKEAAVSFLKGVVENESNDQEVEKVVLSLGASPTATATQNLLGNAEGVQQYRAMLENMIQSFSVEFHAGVYTVNDMQQVAARARPRHLSNDSKQTLLSYSDIGFRILAEVASLYADRGEKPEALVAAGSIVLGREPCKSYPGWGVVTPWPAKSGPHYDPEGSKTGWIVGRISQEHGVLVWEGSSENFQELSLGQKLLLWPNHACIAGVNFQWYLVVESSGEDPDLIRDVWLRWRGW